MGKRDQNRQRRKAQALDATRQIIADEGVEALSMRRLSAVAGMAVNTLYGLFESRAGVLEAVVLDGIERARETITIQVSETPIDALLNMMQVVLNQVIAEASYTQPMFRALSQDRRLMQVDTSHALNVLGMLIDAAKDNGDITSRLDSRLIGAQILTGFREISLRWAFDELSDEHYRAWGRYHMVFCLSAVASLDWRATLHEQLIEAQAMLAH